MPKIRYRLMKLSKLFATLLLIPGLLAIESPTAQATHEEINGCGSGSTLAITPNSPAGVSFQSACNNHDRCYGIIGQTQSQCDKQFHREMLGACARGFNTIIERPLRAVCNGAADVYYTAVRSSSTSRSAYNEAQNHARQSQQQVTASNSLFGAIAYAPNGGWGSAWNHPTRQDAERRALEECNKNNSGCELKVTFTDCAAFARSSDGAWGWATRNSIDEARNAAIENCRKNTNGICNLLTSRCANS